MNLFKSTYGLRQVIILLVSVILIAIFFETFQQLYYINRYNLAEGVTFMDVLQNQAYRWLIWLLLSIVIFWYVKRYNFKESISLVYVLRFVSLIILLVTLNIIIISISQIFVYGDHFSLNDLFTEYLPFFTFQKAPVYTLGYIAITIISYLYLANEKLQVEVQQLSDLKATNLKLYEELKQKNDDKSSILKIKIGNKIKIIPVSEVMWIEADDYCVKVHTIHDKCYTMRSSLKALSLKLDDNFMRVHRKAIANMNMIKELSLSNSPSLVLNDNTHVPIAKSNLKTVKEFLAEH